MSKLIKIAAAVVVTAVGFATGNPALVAAGLSIGSSALAKRPKAPRVNPESIERLNASIDPRTPRKFVFGTTAFATDIRDQEYTDDQAYFHRFIVCAAHEVHAFKEIWFDDKLAWTSGGGVQSAFSGYLTVATITKGSAANAINISARMGSTRRYTGLAYVHLRFKLTGNTKKTESPFAQGIPTRITIEGDAALVYDPRLDSTVAGGSGSHRADDQTTWEWDDDASRNPALCLLWALLGWRIQNPVTSQWELSVGGGIPPERIDLESFAIAANICDESVALKGGGTEPRYRCAGIFSEAMTQEQVISALKICMNADLDDVGGKLRLTIFRNDLSSPVAHFTDDDMVDGFEWRPANALEDSFNIVRGSFTDPSDNSLYQLVEYPERSIASADGIDRIDTFDLPHVQSPTQAQRLAQLRLNRQQYGGEFRTAFNARGWLAQKNSVVTISFSRLGWTEKLFRVAEMEHRVDGTCPAILVEEDAAIYTWTPASDESSPIALVAASAYDPLLNPLIDAIDSASTTAAGAAQTIAITADTQTTAEISFALDPGVSKVITAQIRVTGLSGSSTQKARVEYRVAGGSWATLGTEASEAGGSGDTVFPQAIESLANGTADSLLYEVRAVTSKTGGGSGTVDPQQSFLRA